MAQKSDAELLLDEFIEKLKENPTFFKVKGDLLGDMVSQGIIDKEWIALTNQAKSLNFANRLRMLALLVELFPDSFADDLDDLIVLGKLNRVSYQLIHELILVLRGSYLV